MYGSPTPLSILPMSTCSPCVPTDVCVCQSRIHTHTLIHSRSSIQSIHSIQLIVDTFLGSLLCTYKNSIQFNFDRINILNNNVQTYTSDVLIDLYQMILVLNW